jgi:hypothetical protein
MDRWIRKIHIYLGLLNFSILMVFGLAGLVVTFEAPDITTQKQGPSIAYREFTPPPSASDKQVGQLIWRDLEPAHAGQPVVHRDAANRLVTDFYSVNGRVRVTLFEAEHRIEVETRRNSIWRFIDNAHATTIPEQAGGATRAWAWYIEFSIWALIGMSLSGIWLGMVSRWRFIWARVSFAAGCAVFLALFFLER